MRRIPTGLRGLAVGVLVAAAACSSSRSQESVGSTAQAVTNPVTSRVLSFEQPTTDWSAANLKLQQGDQFVDGQHSAAITVVSSGGKLTSIPLSSLGPISPTVTLQVRLPAYVASTTYQGQVALWLNSPTAGVFNQYFGPFQFSNVQTGIFRQAQFTLPAAIVTALSSSTYSDLTAAVELDFNPNPNPDPNAGFSDPFFIDKLDFGQSSAAGGGGAGGTGGASGSGGATGAGGSGTGGAGAGGAAGAHAQGGSSGAATGGGAGTTGSAGSGTSGPCAFSAQPSGGSTDVAFTIRLPKGVRREDIGVGTTGGYLTLDDGVSIVKDSGGFASVSSVQATSRTNLGVGVEVQDLYTETTGIDLRTNAHVHGALRTAADFTTQTGVVIAGGSLQNTSLEPLESISWNVSFPSLNRGSCSLEPDNVEVIDPGSYGDIAVKSRSHLKVRSGTYYFNSLSFEPQSELDIDNSAGPVFLYVRTSFAFSGSVVETNRTHTNFLFGVAGSGSIAIQTAFRGVLVAPFAGVSLPTDSSVGHVGAFFAQSLIAHQSTAIHLRPLAPSEFCASDAACSSFCPCGDDGGVCGGTAVNHGPAAADPNCVDGACCPTGANVVTLTPGADTSSNSTGSACVLALAGNDTLSSAAPGVTIVGGDGDDTIKTTEFSASGTAEGPMRVFGGPGNDAISGWFDGAQIYGGPGDDTISAGPGPVLIAPGSGADTVSSGEGDDTFILFSECEATPGKKLFANGGFDTLISPLSIDELRARGLTVEGFESVIIKSDACKADCTPKPNCGIGGQCSDRGGIAVCGGGTGATCQTCNDCASGFSCSGGTCQDPCLANPQAPGCSGSGSTPPNCSNGVRDGDETDVDCGGSCAACPTGSGCATNADCGSDGVCGESNGACFGHTRAQRVCWSASCELGTEVGGCGDVDSPCGQNCACVNGCDASSPLSTCAPGEICKKGFGRAFGAPTPDVCVDSRCPSNDPALCGSATSLCGTQCVCTADCSHATCQNPSDGCGGTCPNVCKNGETGCLDDVNCPNGSSCLPNGSGGSICRPGSCAFRVLAPPLCGVSGALCGDTCPACTPSCENRQCGADPVCGQSCGACAAGAFCNSDGQCVTPAADSPPTVPDGQGGQRPLPDLPPSPTNAVGALKGQFSVSDDGTAQYSIPIEVPPGRAGMEPALTLTYSASHLNQDAGVGWHLEGLSKITRCPRSFALDGYSAPVQNDKTDLFCLDGKRLESVSGAYGADGTEYRTLIDSFAKVVSHVDAGTGIQLPQLSGIPSVARELQGPDSFQVFTKDGRILSFGRTSDSLVLARNGTRYAWLLNRVEDRAGNTMVVKYTNIPTNVNSALAARQPNIVRATSISYTGHGDTPGNRSVGFEYETRNDPQVAFFQGGVSFIAPDRLSRLTTFVNGVAVKNYHLQYGPGVLSQIAQISECAGGGDSQCKAPTKFDYTEAHGFSAPQRFDGDDFGTAGELDADGDGVPDFLVSKVKVGDVDANPNLEAAQVTTDVAIGVASSFLSPVGYVAVNVIWDVIQGPFWGMFGSDPSVTVSNQLRFGSRDRNNPLTFVNDISGIRCDTAYNPMFLVDYDQDGKDDIISACGLHSGALFVALSGSARGQLIKFPADGKSVLSVPIGPHPTHGNATPVSTEPPPIMMDVDGDSLQDVIGCEDPYTLDLFRRARPATGSSPLQMTQGFDPTPIQLFAPPAPPNPSGSHEPLPRPKLPLCDGPAPAYKPFDVDGDGTPDLLVRGPSGWVVLRYVAAGGAPSLSFQPVKFIDVGGGTGSAGGGLTLGDFNGDGLQDIRDNGDRNITVWLNAGGGVFTARRLHRPTPPVFIDRVPYSRRATASLDYNGDGQSDLLENWGFTQDVGGGEVIVHNANAALLPDSVVQLLNPVDVPEIKFTLETGQSFPSAFTTSADLDADGSTDVFGANGQVFYGNSAKNTLLSRVVDGLGNFVDVEYDRSDTYSGDTCVGNWPEKCLRHANGLVARHTEGFASSLGADVSERTYTYHYVNGRMSVTGHGWLGFDRRTIDLQAQTGESSTTTLDYEPVARFDLGGAATQSTTPPYIYPFAGLVKTTTVDVHTSTGIGAIKPPLQRDFFDSRTQTINNWQVKMSAFNRPFPFVQTRFRSMYERQVTGGALINPSRPPFEDNGSLVTQCRDSFDMDGYGNVLRGGEQCQGIESFLDEQTTVTSFIVDPIAWIISNPQNVQTFSTHFGTLTERETELTYTSQGLLHTVTRAPHGTDDQRIKTTYDRDDVGNVNQITEEVAGEPARVTSVTYDVDNIFPKTVTNAENQTTQVDFDPSWGQPKAIVDPNGIAVQMSYDGFGRQTQVSGPTGTSVATYSSIVAPNTITAIGSIEPRFQVQVDRSGTAGSRDASSIVEYDNYGRVVRQHSEGFGGVDVISEQAFDSLGRALGRTLPHTAETTPVPFDRYSYDGLQRFARVDHSDGSFREIQYATAVSLDSTRSQWTNGMTCPGLDVSFCAVEFTLTIDEEGRKNALVSDFKGRVVRNIDGENIDSAEKTSNYVYGPFDTLIEAHDNRDIFTSFQFDDYGRKLAQIDPDTGARHYSYNGFDELRTTLDQKHQQRTFRYDTLGRIDHVLDPAGITQWIYDQGENGLGRLSESISPPTPANPSGQHIHYAYEPPTPASNRGLTQSVTYTIDGIDYPINFDYDDLGRTSRVHYPNPTAGVPVVAQYRYDNSGALNGLDEVGSGTAKTLWRVNDVFQGHLIQHETFGNGATTTYGYNPARRWLENIQSTLGTEQIQALDYTHYKNGLVHFRNAAGAVPNEYIYDKLNRLSFTVTHPFQSPVVPTPYEYDDIGNITQRGDKSIGYKEGLPHLISSVGSNGYQYDANGNVSSRSGPDVPDGNQFFSYTPFDLPSSITNGGISPSDPNTKTVTFDYSADQERVLRRDPESVRHFVGDLYQRKLDTFDTTLEERFRLYAGDRQLGEIVRKDGVDKTLYFHTDHLGSTDTISDSDGAATTQKFDPFGAPLSPPNPEITRVGFTGQDQDIDLGLTDMKGRIYDPLAARFTSPDPVIQAPFWSQGLNLYSYTFNDPINHTDPSGFDVNGEDSTLGIMGWGAGVVGAAALSGYGASFGFDSILTGGAAAGANSASPFGFGGLAGAAKAGGTYSVAPTATPRSGTASRETTQAKGQNKWGVGPTSPVVSPVPDGMLTQDITKLRFKFEPQDAAAQSTCPASDCRDNNWVRGQLRNYRRRWNLRLVPWFELMRELHSGGADYDYFSHTPDSWYELRKGQWVTSADFGNYIAGYGAGGGPPLTQTHYALGLTEAAGGFYNLTPDTSGRFGDRHKDTYWIERGFKDGLRDRGLFAPLFELPSLGPSLW